MKSLVSTIFSKRVLIPVVLAVIAAGAAWWGFMRQFLEQPKYAVIESFGEFEVRRYQSRIVAEFEVSGGLENASNEGFRALAGYIFGKNKGQQKIAMTAPVDMKPQNIAMTAPVEMKGEGNDWTMSFTMPSKYTLETLPEPLDPRVRLRKTAPKDFVAIRFRGDPDSDEVASRMSALRKESAARGYALKGEPIYARYDPPSTPGFMRRNEVLQEVSRPVDVR